MRRARQDKPPLLHVFDRGELRVIEVRIEPPLADELGVRPLLNDAAFLEDQDLVGILDRGEAMRHNEGRPPGEERFQCLLDQCLRLAVHTCRRAVIERVGPGRGAVSRRPCGHG
jgi:hypothetical protein